MPTGIIATDDGNGFVTLDFVDKSLRGPALATLAEIGGPATIETISRSGPRRKYRVPAGNAAEAGLLDEAVAAVRSAGHDTGAAQALKDADPNVNPGDDGANWHTPVAEHTSANAFVGQVPNAEVMDRGQVHTGDADSSGGTGAATTHRDTIAHVLDNSSTRAVGGRNADIPVTEGTREPVVPASQLNLGLKDQTGAVGSDPGAWGDQGGESLAEDYTTVQASPAPTPAPATAPTQTWPDGTPTEDWKRAELDAYALSVKGIDTSQEPNKAAVVTAIQNAPTPS